MLGQVRMLVLGPRHAWLLLAPARTIVASPRKADTSSSDLKSSSEDVWAFKEAKLRKGKQAENRPPSPPPPPPAGGQGSTAASAY